MPENKNQHVVPQFYLRRFATDKLRRQINLYLLAQGEIKRGASIRRQASKSYYYGRGTEGSVNFRKLETDCARLLDEIIRIRPPALDSPGYILLAIYIGYQLARTPYHAQSIVEAFDKTWDASVSLHPNPEVGARLRRPRLSVKQAIDLALKRATQSIQYMRGLGVAVIVNSTKLPFMCSDNPVVLYNQLMERHGLREGTTGFVQKGIQIFFPIGPGHLLLLYDLSTYKVGRRSTQIVNIDSETDVLELNRLQYLSADKCIYFGTGISESDITHLAKYSAPFRRPSKMKVKVRQAPDYEGRSRDVISMSEHDIQCRLTLSFVKLTKNGKDFKPGTRIWHPRSEALGRIVRAEWEAQHKPNIDEIR